LVYSFASSELSLLMLPVDLIGSPTQSQAKFELLKFLGKLS
jgi:hypothetical protein